MSHVKNAGGGPGDEDPRPPPRLPTNVKGKATKKITSKKRKYVDDDTSRAAAVAAAAERRERRCSKWSPDCISVFTSTEGIH